jgi:hypothetical protein
MLLILVSHIKVKHGMRVFENGVLRKTFGTKKEARE